KVLKQKTKIEWLKEGDHISAYFHNFLKGRLNRSRIISIKDDVGVVYHDGDVAPKFVDHFQTFLGTCDETFPIEDLDGLFIKKIDAVRALHMVKDVTNEEIKSALLKPFGRSLGRIFVLLLKNFLLVERCWVN
ncbi:hypothetical protein Tco_0346442, partial [Tanacetum coccineum]